MEASILVTEWKNDQLVVIYEKLVQARAEKAAINVNEEEAKKIDVAASRRPRTERIKKRN